MRRLPLTFAVIAASLLTVSCTSGPARQTLEDLQRNPLMAETIADNTIDYVTRLQIRAGVEGRELDPATLRAIDQTLVDHRTLRDKAHVQEDAGKRGEIFGIDNDFARGNVLLSDTSLFFGYSFEMDAAPDMHVYLAQHIAPHTSEDLFSAPTMDLGSLQNLIGPQEYPLGELTPEDRNAYRTVAFYSVPLKRVVALAQVRQQVVGE